MSLGPVVGSFLFDFLGYVKCFYVFGSFNILGGILLYAFYPKKKLVEDDELAESLVARGDLEEV